MESIWANDAPRIVQNYTDHGVEHSERIAYFVDKLLKVNPNAEFLEPEIYLLLAGVYLHDIGMQCDIVRYPEIKERAEDLGAKFDREFTSETTNGYSPEEQNEIRKNHHYLSAAWIDYLYEKNDSVLSPWIKSVPDDLVDDLMDVCKFHSKLSIDDCSDYFTYYPNSRKKMVAALLRFADELDISSKRVKIETVKLFSINPDNGVYWWLHNYTKVDFVDLNKVLLNVRLHPEDFKSYGSFVREEYITHFKSKNQPVLEVMIEQKISLIIDTNSDVVEHRRAEKFPPEITAVLDKMIQKGDSPTNSQIPFISEYSGSGSTSIESSQPNQESKSTKSNVPYLRNHLFTGRDDKLSQIHEVLLSKKVTALSQPIAVCGLGGIGKTQTAIEYTYRYLAEYKFVFWVKGESEDSIISDYVSVAKFLDLPVKNDADQSLVVSAVKNWLRTNENWLLVFDNADEPEIVKNFLPSNPKGHILLTSRAQLFDNLGITSPIIMEKMHPDEARKFFTKRTGRKNLESSERKALEELTSELDYLPLAIEQAGAYIKKVNSSFANYLTSYKKRGLNLLEQFKVVADKYPKSVATTWLLNFEKVEQISKASAEILYVSAFLKSSNIPSEIFIKGAQELGPEISSALEDVENDPLVFDEILEPLTQYSLITRDTDKQTYDIHRLVQAVLKDGMNENKQQLWVEHVVKAVNLAFPEVEYKNWELCDRLLPHAQTCAEHIKWWNIETEDSGKLLNAAGKYLHKRARFKESESLLTGSLNIRKKVLGPKHLDISESLNNLAELIRDLGRYSEAEILNMRALEIRENVLNPEDPVIAESLDNLALVYSALGRYSEAEPLCARALELTEKSLGPDHPDVGIRLNNLAAVYSALGRYSEAEPLYIRALELTEKSLGSDHPTVGTCLNNIAIFYHKQNKYRKARLYYERAIKVMENTGGENSLKFVDLFEMYASLLIKMRKNREATKINNQAKRIRSKIEREK